MPFPEVSGGFSSKLRQGLFGSRLQRNGQASLALWCAMYPSMATMHSSSESKTAFFSRCLDSFETTPSTAFIQNADVGVKWNVQPVRPISHSRTSVDLCDETLSRMTCTVEDTIPQLPRQRQTVGFDRPIYRRVSASPQPAPSSRTMRIADDVFEACTGRVRKLDLPPCTGVESFVFN